MTLSRRHFLQTTMAFAAAQQVVPAIALEQPAEGLSFLVIGDWGKPGLTIDAGRVAGQMAFDAEANAASFVISTGDNFYEDGVADVSDPLWQSAYEDIYTAASLQCPWYVVLGNHDYRGNPDAEIAYSLRSTRWRMPARYYVIQQQLADGTAADFFYLDTNMFVDVNFGNQWFDAGSDAQEQLDWLEEVLGASRATWKIVVGHHPVFSGGEHGSTNELIVGVKPLLERYGVQAYLNGHDHDLQHIEVSGVHYLTSGGGAEFRPTKKLDNSLFAAASRGFLAASLSANEMSITFIDDQGAVLHAATIMANVKELAVTSP